MKPDNIIFHADEEGQLSTMINHGYLNADGSRRDNHCCGCWVVILDLEGARDWPIYARCNECGEERNLDCYLNG